MNRHTVYILKITPQPQPYKELGWYVDYMLTHSIDSMTLIPPNEPHTSSYDVALSIFSFSTNEDMRLGLRMVFESAGDVPLYITSGDLDSYRSHIQKEEEDVIPTTTESSNSETSQC